MVADKAAAVVVNQLNQSPPVGFTDQAIHGVLDALASTGEDRLDAPSKRITHFAAQPRQLLLGPAFRHGPRLRLRLSDLAGVLLAVKRVAGRG